ncbi:MAG: hypothetical protein IJL08_07310 [Oscillospiraceae bacterium]|nr:hypothetical protein [Oscillospiraceae bacterium]
MKSHVVKLFDYQALELPEELRHWRVSNGDVQAQLELIARNHAIVIEREAAEQFDCVRCQISGGTFGPGSVTLVYPGRGLCPALEETCTGIRVGEQRTATLDGATVELNALRIVCMEPAPIDDLLIRAEGIDGVQTVDEYRVWWKAQEEDKRRYEQGARGAFYVMEQLEKGSEFQVDPEELEEALRAEAKRTAALYEQLPEEMRMTVEEAAEELRPDWEARFTAKLLRDELVERLRTKPMEQVLEDGKTIYIERNLIPPETVEQMVQINPDGARETFLEFAVLEYLRTRFTDGKLEV